MKPSLFVGSSTEGLEIAYAIQANLEHVAEPTVWDQGVFGLTKSTLATLIECLDTFDFGVFVLSPDDVAKIRSTKYSIARDNVVFELGLFIGALGTLRTFFVVPRGCPNLHLPSDLAGITAGAYDADRKDKNLRAALGPACQAIKSSLSALGARRSSLVAGGGTTTSAPDPTPASHTIVTDGRNTAVAAALRTFIEEADAIRSQVVAKAISHEDAEVPLVRWKIKVCRFLDRTVGVADAKSFLALYTSHNATTGDQHFRSAYENHIGFLEVLAAEIEDDPAYPLPDPPQPSGKLSFAGLRFTYAGRR